MRIIGKVECNFVQAVEAVQERGAHRWMTQNCRLGVEIPDGRRERGGLDGLGEDSVVQRPADVRAYAADRCSDLRVLSWQAPRTRQVADRGELQHGGDASVRLELGQEVPGQLGAEEPLSRIM